MMPDLRTAAERFSAAAPSLTALGSKLNRFGNTVSYNPRGAEPGNVAGRDEGYLYWVAWASHVGNSIFSTGDANGYYWRIYLSQSCEGALNIVDSVDPAVGNLLETVTGLTSDLLQQVGCL